MHDSQGAQERLPDPARRLHRALMDTLIVEGAIPPSGSVAASAELAMSDLPALLRSLEAADYAACDAAGRLTCLYPFSVTPTPHSVVIDGRRRHAMCAIDALGIPAMLGQELVLAGFCAICDAPIALRVRPGLVVTASPLSVVVVARRDESEPAFAACCPFTVFACNTAHADQFASQISGAHVLSLSEALKYGEEIFGGLLTSELPATRQRGADWGRSHDD